MSKDGFYPEVQTPHMPGIWLETKEQTGNIAVMLYAYIKVLKDPEKESSDLLSWWKEICREAEQLALDHGKIEPEPDMGMDF